MFFVFVGLLGTVELGAQSILLQLDGIWFQASNKLANRNAGNK